MRYEGERDSERARDMRYYTGVWDGTYRPGYSGPPVLSKGRRTWIRGIGVINEGVIRMMDAKASCREP